MSRVADPTDPNEPAVGPVGFWRHVLWRVEYVAVRGAEFLLLATPPAAAEGARAGGGARLLPARRAAAPVHAREPPRGVPRARRSRRRRRLALASFEHAFVLLLEIVRRRRRRARPARRSARATACIGDVDALREDIRAGRGGILLTAHLGNWEVAGAYLALRARPVRRDLARRCPTRTCRRTSWGRAAAAFEVLGKRGAVRDTVRAVREGRWVAILGDQNAGRYGVFVPVLRRSTPAPTRSRRASSARHGFALYFCVALRRGPGVHYDFHVRRYVAEPGPRRRRPPQRDILLAYHAALEEWIRLAPEQYLWMHRRWKTRPPGEVPGPHLPVYDHRSEAERARREAAKATARRRRAVRRRGLPRYDDPVTSPRSPAAVRPRPLPHEAPRGPRATSSRPGASREAVAPTASAADVRRLPARLPRRAALRDLARRDRPRARREGRPIVWGLGGHVVKVGLAPAPARPPRPRLRPGLRDERRRRDPRRRDRARGRDERGRRRGPLRGRVRERRRDGRLFAEARGRRRDVGARLRHRARRRLARAPAAQRRRSRSCAARAGRACPSRSTSRSAPTRSTCTPPATAPRSGAATHADFRRLATLVEGMDGGVYVNVGSAVLLPEVFLKAVAIVHNANRGTPRVRITTGNLDFLKHYRPRVNVVERPAVKGYEVTGHHEILVPLLRIAILAARVRRGAGAAPEGARGGTTHDGARPPRVLAALGTPRVVVVGDLHPRPLHHGPRRAHHPRGARSRCSAVEPDERRLGGAGSVAARPRGARGAGRPRGRRRPRRLRRRGAATGRGRRDRTRRRRGRRAAHEPEDAPPRAQPLASPSRCCASTAR